MMDKNLSLKEKSAFFSEEIRVNINSLRDLMEFINNKATDDQYLENYSNKVVLLNTKLEKGEIVPASSSTGKQKAFVPSYKENDRTLHQAKFVV